MAVNAMNGEKIRAVRVKNKGSSLTRMARPRRITEPGLKKMTSSNSFIAG